MTKVNLLTTLALCLLLSLGLAQTTLELRIALPEDDAEEFLEETRLGPAGTVYLDSSDLELTEDIGATQVVGLRFADAALPQGAQIVSAHIQFAVKEESDRATDLVIAAQASDDAPPFDTVLGNLSSRVLGSSSVPWSPAPWLERNQAGEAQRTPDLSTLVQEVVSRPGWVSGNALAVVISGSGHRVAWSLDGRPQSAPRLVVSYQLMEAEAPAQEAPVREAPAQPVEPTEPEVTEPEATEPEPAETTEAEVAAPAQPEPAESPAAGEAVVAEPAPPSDRQREARYALAGEGLRGSLLVADYGQGTVLLTLLLSGREVGGRSAALGLGDCDAPGDVLLRLEPTNTGGYSVTPSNASFSMLTQANLQLRVLENPDGSGAVLACGEVGPG